MSLKIAIHNYKDTFTQKIIKYCNKYNINYNLVNCYDNNIISILEGYEILIWIWNIDYPESYLFAKELIYALEQKGIRVFPDFKSSLIYDNKISQKYLLESVNAPIVNTYIFYSKKNALHWIQKTKFPKVFKLSKGAGSNSVYLCKDQKEAKRLMDKAFNRGFSVFNRKEWFIDNMNKFLSHPSKITFQFFLRAIARLFIPTKREKTLGKEQGYLYFQDFIRDNSFDIRVITIGNRAIAIKRVIRDNDFRASGSGKIIYNKDEINIQTIKMAFDISEKLNFICMAYDFIFKDNKPLIVEISYHFSATAYNKCNGYWDKNLKWHQAIISPQNMIMEALLEKD